MSATLVRMFVARKYRKNEIAAIGAAFSWAGINCPVVPDRYSHEGKSLVAEAYAAREKRRMDKEYCGNRQ